ncbi:hypothetical protein, partial [Mesomycoplasma hyorhinis]|uniref:hypothetical protein n=1 Tax=Mesomycoplasma hyorhinis TaxID=2100 RepID=UPI001C04C506
MGMGGRRKDTAEGDRVAREGRKTMTLDKMSRQNSAGWGKESSEGANDSEDVLRTDQEGWEVFFFKQETAYEILRCLVGSEMCIRDRFINNLSSKFKIFKKIITSFF